jgi:hypothetical protein
MLDCKKFTAVLMLALSAFPMSMQSVAHAGVISPEQFISAQDRRATIDSITATLARDEVRAALQRHGVDPSLAVERVAALNDQELILLADNLEQLPAGSSLVGTIGVVAIVLLILELLGVIDIFTKF